MGQRLLSAAFSRRPLVAEPRGLTRVTTHTVCFADRPIVDRLLLADGRLAEANAGSRGEARPAGGLHFTRAEVFVVSLEAAIVVGIIEVIASPEVNLLVFFISRKRNAIVLVDKVALLVEEAFLLSDQPVFGGHAPSALIDRDEVLVPVEAIPARCVVLTVAVPRAEADAASVAIACERGQVESGVNVETCHCSTSL